MLKRNSLFVLVLVLAVSLSGCFGFLGSKIDKLVLSATKTEIGLADEDKTIELNVVGKDKKDKDIVVDIEDVKWTVDPAADGEVKIVDGKTILTIKATKAGDVTVKGTFDKVVSTVVTIKVNEGETPTDFTALDTAITAAEALKTDTGTGEAVGEAAEAAHTAFATAIAAAKAVKADPEAKQPAVDAAVTALQTAQAAFEDAIVAPDPVLLSESFEDYEVGTVPVVEGYTFSGNASISSTKAGEGTKSVELPIPNPKVKATLLIGFDQPLTNHKVSFMINKEKSGGTFNFDLVNGTTRVTGAQLTDGLTLRYRDEALKSVDSSPKISLTVDKWETIEIEINAAEKFYRIYHGTGEDRVQLTGGEGTLSDFPYTSEASINGILFENDGKTDTRLYIDNVVVTEL